MSVTGFTINTDKFEIEAQCSIPAFQKRGELVMTLVRSAVEMSLKYCEELSEKDLGSNIDWTDRDEIVSIFLDCGGFQKWAEMVAFDLGESAVQIPD